MTTFTNPACVKRARIESVDLLRGVIMILMALDHTRDFFGTTSVNPTDPARISLRKRSIHELARFLVTRGLWLIFLERTVFRCLGFQFNFDYQFSLLNVL